MWPPCWEKAGTSLHRGTLGRSSRSGPPAASAAQGGATQDTVRGAQAQWYQAVVPGFVTRRENSQVV